MADVLALVGTAIDTVRKLKEVSDKIKDAESRNLIGDLSLSLADLKIEIAGLKEENLRLQGELAEAKKKKQQAGELVARENVLWFKEPPEGKPAGPYCPNCKENSNRLVLIKTGKGTPFAQVYNFRCPECKSSFLLEAILRIVSTCSSVTLSLRPFADPPHVFPRALADPFHAKQIASEWRRIRGLVAEKSYQPSVGQTRALRKRSLVIGFTLAK